MSSPGTTANGSAREDPIGKGLDGARVVAIAPFRDLRRRARSLYWQGWTLEEAAEALDLSYDTVKSWKRRGGWDASTPLARCEDMTEARYVQLVAKEKKSGADFKEIDLLGRQMAQFARIRRYEAPGGHEGDLNENVAKRNAWRENGGSRKKPPVNLITPEQVDKLAEAVEVKMLRYQNNWYASSALRTRFILKSRQIGATWHFARERLIRALKTGNNQIFISASRAQANIFRQYIVDFVQEQLDIKLTGDPIVIDRGEEAGEDRFVRLYFLGTNYRTAQGYHGDVIIDEAFWIHGFAQLNKVASAMATHKRYSKTYFSTPSTIDHEAFPLWSGERYNAKRAREDRHRFDTSHAALKDGAMGVDGIFRQIVTIDDAIEGGAEFLDLDELQLEHGADEFENLFRCVFLDDSKSKFPLSMMRRCMVDAWEVWKDFRPYALRPFAEREVWLGYDPQESEAGDNAALVVVAPPAKPGGKFRILEKLQWRGKDFIAQGEAIRALTDKYNVTYIAIDKTGVGNAVYQVVKGFFPQVVGIDYSPVVKAQMVLKAESVISRGRLEFDAGWTDMAMSFAAIHIELTSSQRMVTYVARRSAETGHADLAWAVMHVLFNEPMDAATVGGQRARVVIGD